MSPYGKRGLGFTGSPLRFSAVGVPRARFELARLTAPPPQDGVSTSSTTWALRGAYLAKGTPRRKRRVPAACHVPTLRYSCSMNTELQQEATVHDLELSDACACCGGPVHARFTPGSARGVCVSCRLVTSMALVKSDEGIRIVQAPAGSA